MSRVFCALLIALLILTIGATACWPTASEQQPQQMKRSTPSATPKTVDSPTAASKVTLHLSSPAPTASPEPVPSSTAVPDVPSPTPTATLAPKPTPTTTETPVPVSPEYDERAGAFIENFKSISFEASLQLPSQYTESGSPVKASASGWIMANGESQIFIRIEMTEPVERSIEVVTLNSFNIYLKDLDEEKWYFVPENSDTGPLEDILPMPFMALAFGAAPTGSLKPVQDGYVWKIEDPSWGTLTASYDQAYTLNGITQTDANGQEVLRAGFFDLNKSHDIIPHEKGELLPDTYWESRE